jgi:hypothetical protein
MHTEPRLILAAIGIPGARQFFGFLAPILLVAILGWFVRRTDQIVARLFPDWEWEQRLGWLNLQAERQADFFFRWTGYLVYSILAAALYGIVWCAETMPDLNHWDDPYIMGELALRIPVLLVSLSLLLVYFGVWLIPKLRNEYETELLEKFNREQKRIEDERKEREAELRASNWSNPSFGSFGRSDRIGPKHL